MTNITTVGIARGNTLKTWKLDRVLTIGQRETAAQAAAVMAAHDVGSLVVLGPSRQVAGIVTERDVITKVVSRGTEAASVTVGEIMTANVISCRTDTTIDQVRRLMAAHNVRHLPVIENGAPLGMVSARDLMAYELSQCQLVARRQSEILEQLEREHPEVVHWRRDTSGRLVID